MNNDRITKAWNVLREKGWSDLIDKKWKKDVTNTLKNNFPDMDKETLEHVLECVLI